ncbi:MAG: peptidoglycan DD-metalloendopeptidase family protein, partial [Tissierellia bacterium]|nr:peptidoglycan DD-metalloendopeptidase family protein [Tissierellia bacterium]
FWYFEPFAWVEQMKRVFSISKWRDPVDNPQITLYTSGGNKRPWRSAFGYVRQDLNRHHHGLDLFAVIGTPVYACLPGKIVGIIDDAKGYGYGFILKIDKDYLEEFKNQRRNYEPYYVKSKRIYSSKEYSMSGYNYDFEEYEGIKESDDVFLAYAHLSEVNVTLNQVITADEYQTKELGKTGDTGEVAKGTKGPHLHFEIRSVVTHKKGEDKYASLYNPAYYVNYKNETQLSEEERKIQDKTAGK